MPIIYGRQIEWGVKAPLPLCGFPAGRARIRMRSNRFVTVCIRPPAGGIRRFTVEARHGGWWPAFETGASVYCDSDGKVTKEKGGVV
jgi:hypothetical protein